MPKTFTVASGRASLAGTTDGGEDSGGPPLVFLHAGVADQRMWQAQMAAFAPTRRVVAYDRRGFGDTEGPAETFSHVDDLKAVLDHLMLEPPVLVGASQGGRIAIDFALTYPDGAAGRFLVSPAVTGAPSPGEYPPAVEALLDQVEEAEEAEDLERVNRLEAWIWLDGPAGDEGRVGGALRDLFLDMNAIALKAPEPGDETNPASSPAAYTRLGDLKLPAQVLWGDLDFSHIQQRCMHLVQAMPRAVGSAIPGSAHLPNLEQPDVFNRHLQTFLVTFVR